jgi:hypothetical protein
MDPTPKKNTTKENESWVSLKMEGGIYPNMTIGPLPTPRRQKDTGDFLAASSAVLITRGADDFSAQIRRILDPV